MVSLRADVFWTERARFGDWEADASFGRIDDENEVTVH